ncbi:MAG: ABC-type Na+ efflux pump permease subunit [Methanobacteriota archaeon]
MRPRKVLRIARWEVSRSAGGLDRRSLAYALVALLLVAGVAPFAVDGGLYDGLYVVGVDEESGYHDAVERSETLRAVEPSEEAFSSGRLDVLVTDGVRAADTGKGRAAVSELRDAVRAYNADLLDGYDTAYPVSVDLRYVDRGTAVSADDASESVSGGSSGGDGTEGGTDGGTDVEASGEEDGFSFPSGGLDGVLGQGGRAGTPGGITPPFPFSSLVLAFAFLVPLNFVIQAYSTSIMNERIDRRGVLTLASPVSRYEIVAGKTVPYFAIALGTVAVVAVAVSGGVASVVAVAPVAFVFLALTFVGSMFARSYKELTFVTVFVSVSVTSYVFVPAVFTDVDPIAAISPLSIVVRDLQGATAPVSWYLFSGAPLVFSSAVLFSLGAGVYREEDMFTQRPVRLKALDALVSWLHRRASVAKVSVLLIPFVFVAQLLVVAVVFALPVGISVPLLLVVAAVVEETAKSMAVYAGFVSSVFERTTPNAVVLGALSGVGFFVGEKAAHLAQVVGLDRLEVGRAALGIASDASPLVLAVLLVAPLVLHTVTTCIASVGASYGKREFGVGLSAAVAVHVAYNLAVVSLVA